MFLKKISSRCLSACLTALIRYQNSYKEAFRYPVSGVPGIFSHYYGCIPTIRLFNEPHACTEKSLKGTARKDWMKGLADQTPVSLLSIPGTHGSGTYTCSTYYYIGINQTQSLSIADQLQAGIRYLDLKVKMSEKQIRIHHGPFLYQKLEEVLTTVRTFLGNNPSETVILAFQAYEEPDLSERVKEALKNSGLEFVLSKDVQSKKIPLLKELRGKVWILGGSHITFKDQTLAFPFKLGLYETRNVYVQNFYQVSGSHDCYDIGFAEKWGKVIEGAFDTDASRSRLKINYLSGCISQGHRIERGIQKYFASQIARNDKGCNFLLAKQLRKVSGSLNLGVTVMDFPGDELIDLIIRTNKQ